MSWPKNIRSVDRNGMTFIVDRQGRQVTLCAMGCVKPANDDEEFYKMKRSRESVAQWSGAPYGLYLLREWAHPLYIQGLFIVAPPDAGPPSEYPPPPIPPP